MGLFPSADTERGARSEAVRVWLLGGFRVSIGSRNIEDSQWRLRKAAALVKLLALAPGHRMHREQAMDLLWPELGKKAASNNLRQALHAARRTLTRTEGSRYLASDSESLVLCPGGSLWVDVDTFEEAEVSARRSRDPAAYRAAIELYAGELLPQDRYEEWADTRREELRRRHLALLIELAELYGERGEHGRAVVTLQRALSEESTNEEAHASLIRLYALAGRQGEALTQYERLQEILSERLDTEPGPTTRRLRDEIAAGRPPPTAPARHPQEEEPSDARKHNLPASRTSFVGREREMVEVKRTLSMTRLLTLTGAGGSGKTRLALEVARDLIGAYPDGVWLVELAPLSEGRLVAQEVARALEVQERPGQALTDTLVDALGDKEMLLVVDNCEHLVEAVARLVDTLLDSCAHLRVLATSREPLDVPDEVNWVVPPLSLPDPERTVTVEELEGYGSARLFVERALYRPSTFALTPENARAVAEVCRQLEGIPLAIELAAARVGALAVEQISERLSDSLKLLTGGGRTVTPRQQTLRGSLEWSYDLLSEAERKAFGRLSVFAGGWTLEAAEAVVSGEGIEEGDVLDLLSRLIDKSLVVAEVAQDSPIRYRLLEPIRQYSRERLEESEEVETVLRRHAVFFLALAEEAELGIEGPQQAAWLDLLETEHDNMRAALSWSLGQGDDAELGLRMGAALGEFWYLRGYLSEGRKWLDEALAKSGQASTATRARALHRVAWLALLLGDLDQSEEASEEGLGLEDVELFRTRGYDSVAAELQRTLGIAMEIRGQFERAMELFEESLALSREAGSVRGMSISLFGEGVVSRAQGDLERATNLLEEALTLCRESGDPALLASILTHLGYTFVLQGDLERATAVSEEAAAMLREQKHRAYLADALKNLGWVAVLRGDSEQAKSPFAESLRLRLEVGDKQAAPETLLGLACAATRGEAGRATKLFGTVEAMREMMGIQPESAERALQEPYLAAARRQQSEAGWEKAWEEGKSMSFEEAIEYALSDEETATPVPTALERPSPRTQQPDLTRREEEVASLVAQGLTNRQIATEVSISEHTVATHVGKTMKKLGLSSRSQLAAWVTEQGWPTSDSG